MGEAVGKVNLDVSGVKKGAQEAAKAFSDLDSMSAQSVADVEAYAKTLMDALNTAYQSVAQNSSAAQAAQAAYNAVLEANKSTLDAYGKAVAEAEQRHAQAQSVVAQKQAEYNQALQIANQQLQRYNELKEREGVNQRALQSNYEKYQRDLFVVKEAQTALVSAQKEASKSEQEVLKAKQQYANVAKAADTEALKSQRDIAKENTKTAETVIKNATALERARIQSQANIEKANIAAVQRSVDTETKAQQKAIADIEKAKINAQRDIEKANIAAAERSVEKEVEAEKKAAATVEKAKIDSQAKIEKAKIDADKKAATQELAIRQKAQTDIEKAMIASETKLQQTKIQEAGKGARQAAELEQRERERATKEAQREQERAAQDISNKQAMAFALAAKAVDEVVNGVKRLAQEMLNLSKQIVTIGADFETSMAQVAATSGMTSADIQANISDYADLVEAAKEAGLTTMFSASQAGEALNYLALAGYSVQESIETMPDILTIAAAGAMDLGRASDMVTDAMNALDLSIDDTNDFIDKMAKTAQSSNTNVEQLGGAILTVGGTATILAGGVTELDTALGVLANSGIKARQGGTALRQILLNLTDPSEKAAKMIEELGLDVFDLDGNLRPLNKIFSDLNDIMKDFTDEQRMNVLGTIFDARQVRAATALMQGVNGAWGELENKINNAEGAAEKMAETMRSNLNGALNIAKSNLDAIAITLYEGIQKNITDLVKEAIPKFQELNSVLASPEVQARLHSMSEELKEIALKVLDIAIDAAPKIIDVLSNVTANIKALEIAIWAIMSMKLIANIGKLQAAFVALTEVMITNPFLAVIAAVSALTVAMIELAAESKKESEARIEAIKAENDLYAEQRNQISQVVDSWDEYKEAAAEATQKTAEQKDKVTALYEEYKHLYKSGQDTTLAMEALADEIPELKTMLAEGKTSFEDITESVDAYTDALIRNAQIEAGKDTYVQATQTVSKLEKVLDSQTQAVQESQDAWLNAKQATIDYANEVKRTTGTSEYSKWSREQQQQYLRLKEQEQALLDIHQENAIAWADTQNTLAEARQAQAEAEQGYTDAVRTEAHERGELLIGEAEGAKAAGEAYAKERRAALKKETEVNAEANQKLVDDIDAGIADVERHIQLRDAGYSDQSKIDFYKNWFGTHEDWDRNNADLVKHFDAWQTLEEKKAKEARDQIEKEGKEREKLAKEQADILKKSVDNSVSQIDWFAGLRGDTADKQSRQLKDFVKENVSYYQQYPDEYEKMVQKIAGLDKQWLSNTELTGEELKKYLNEIAGFYGEDSDIAKALTNLVSDTELKHNQEQAEKYFKSWTDGYDKLVDDAVKAYSNLEKERDNFQKKLLDSIELYSEESQKVWDKTKHQYVDGDKEIVVSSKAMKEQLKEIQDFDKVMESLRSKDIGDDLLAEIYGMDIDKATEFGNKLNKMSDKELSAYVQAYQEIHEKTDEMTSKYYQQELDKFQTEYMQPLKDYVSGDQSELKEAMKYVGVDSVQGYIDGITSKRDEAEKGTRDIYEGILQDVKNVLGIASPSKEFYAVGEFTIQGFLNGVQSRVSQVASIFKSLGQSAGNTFVEAFRETWDNFTTLMSPTIPVAMVTPTFGTPTMANGQIIYSNTANNYTGLTREDVMSAIREAMPDGDVVLQVDKVEFGRVSRDSLNLLAEQQGRMGLKC